MACVIFVWTREIWEMSPSPPADCALIVAPQRVSVQKSLLSNCVPTLRA